MPSLRPLLLALIVLYFSAGWTSSVAAQTVSREREIRAGIVALLGRYVTWPPNVAPGGAKPLQIGVLGDDPFQEGNINHLDDKVRGQKVRVQRFASLDNYQPCHILVVSRSADIKAVVKKLKGQPVLIVGEAPGSAADGAVLNLVFNQARNNIELELNHDAANEAKLVLNASFVRLCKPVKQG